MSLSRESAYRTPRWVKVFGAFALIVFAIFAALHIVGGGMGHMAHGEMDGHAPPAEPGQHQP